MNIRELKFLTVAAVVALGLGLAGCGGGGSDTAEAPPVVEPEPTPYEAAKANIAAATTAADAQAAYDAVKDDVTAAQGEALQDAVDMRVAALATAARVAMQRANLMTAAGGVDTSDLSTQAGIDTAQAAIDALQAAIDAAADIDDTSMYESQVAAAQGEVDAAQTALDTSTATMNRMEMQRTALANASTALMTALDGLTGTPTQAQIDAAQGAVDALQAAIDGAADLDDTSMYAHQVSNAEGRIASAETTLAANNAAQEEQDRKDAAAAAAARAARAAKLIDGIYAPAADATGTAASDVHAAYNQGDTAIEVTIGTGGDTPAAGTAVTLSEDKDATVASLSGWTGKRYADPAGGDSYVAVVYSNVGEPTQGDKFGQIGVGTPVAGYKYGLSAAGAAAVDTATTAAYVNLVGGSNFDQSAGVKRFPLPSPNPGLSTVVSVPGTFHGVSGTYTCTPGDAVCAANVSGRGFELGTVVSATDATFTDGGGAWMFKPSNPEARVTDAPDSAYASYGWWLKTAMNGDLTASAFADEKGTVDAASGLDALNGTATYQGGAAGQYALSSSTGGENDSGSFTARATLEANFTNNTDDDAITGTIDQFVGADGESRDWSVKLNASDIGDEGGIGNAGDGTDNVGTVWTIGDNAADASGEWTGTLRNNGTDSVPQVATGTFFSQYGEEGKMVGAFGAKKQ